jgi:hypothetical protein
MVAASALHVRVGARQCGLQPRVAAFRLRERRRQRNQFMHLLDFDCRHWLEHTGLTHGGVDPGCGYQLRRIGAVGIQTGLKPLPGITFIYDAGRGLRGIVDARSGSGGR